jgi:hypothetical protein
MCCHDLARARNCGRRDGIETGELALCVDAGHGGHSCRSSAAGGPDDARTWAKTMPISRRRRHAVPSTAVAADRGAKAKTEGRRDQ